MSRLRVFYMAGPGDVAGTFAHWSRGEDDPREVAICYSSHFFQTCQELDAEAYVLSSNARAASLRAGWLTLEQRPKRARSGLAYHRAQLRYELGLCRTILGFRPHVAVIGGDVEHYYLYAALSRLGVAVVPSLHCALRQQRGERRAQRVLRRAGRGVFRRSLAVMTVSSAISRQARALAGPRCAPIVEFLPTYREATFAGIPAPNPTARPFRVLFAGRVEVVKGARTLVEIARHLRALGHGDLVFDVCGEGGALDQLRGSVAAAGLSDTVLLHGRCERAVMRDMLGRSHAVIVPTTPDFAEGFNKVLAEGVLARRPVVTSRVCPALAYVRGAALEVPPDDALAYAQALIRLKEDAALYRELCREAELSRRQFLDPQRSWGAGLRRILTAAHRGEPPQSVSWEGVPAEGEA